MGSARSRCKSPFVQEAGVFPLTDCPSDSPGDVYCFNDVNEYNTFFNGTIELRGIEMTGNFTNQSDIDALLAQADTMQRKYVEVGRRCKRHSDGKYLKYIGTAATARDLLALADALDGPGSPVNYFGYSYGTVLGSWFVNSTCSLLSYIVAFN